MRRYLWFALLLLPFLLSPFPFYVTLLNFFAIAALVALSLYVLTGLGGMTSFAQAAFMGVSAYATALLTTRAGVSPWAGLALGLGLTLAFALVLGLLTVRLKGHFLPLSTIAWQVAFYILAGNLVGLTGGHTGLTDLPALSLGSFSLDSPFRYAFLSLFLLALLVLALHNLRESRLGRALLALRGDALTAASFGVDPAALRLKAFLLAGGIAGLVGFLYAHFLRFVNPTPFSLEASIKYLVMAVAGGVGTIPGVLLGSALFTGLEDWLKDLLPLLLGRQGNYETIAYGLVLAGILLFAPQGLWPLLAGKRAFGRQALPEAKPLPQRPPSGRRGEVVLEARGLRKAFGGLLAVNGVSFALRRGEILALIGPNGAGKTSVLKGILGLARAEGEVRLGDTPLPHRTPEALLQQGVVLVPEGRALFPGLSVEDNLLLGGFARFRRGENLKADFKRVYALFPRLEERRRQLAGTLSGGEQQMLAIGRALMARPRLLLLDEPSLGLAPLIVQEIFRTLAALKGEGVTLLLVEQNAKMALSLADRGVVLEAGEVALSGRAEELRENPRVVEAYLGAAREVEG